MTKSPQCLCNDTKACTDCYRNTLHTNLEGPSSIAWPLKSGQVLHCTAGVCATCWGTALVRGLPDLCWRGLPLCRPQHSILCATVLMLFLCTNACCADSTSFGSNNTPHWACCLRNIHMELRAAMTLFSDAVPTSWQCSLFHVVLEGGQNRRQPGPLVIDISHTAWPVKCSSLILRLQPMAERQMCCCSGSERRAIGLGQLRDPDQRPERVLHDRHGQ